MVKLFGKPIKVNKASQDKRTQEVGANLFIGNLDLEVDEKMLYDTFSSFGMILSTKVNKLLKKTVNLNNTIIDNERSRYRRFKRLWICKL